MWCAGNRGRQKFLHRGRWRRRRYRPLGEALNAAGDTQISSLSLFSFYPFGGFSGRGGKGFSRRGRKDRVGVGDKFGPIFRTEREGAGVGDPDDEGKRILSRFCGLGDLGFLFFFRRSLPLRVTFPQKNMEEKTHPRLHKMTLQQKCFFVSPKGEKQSRIC